MLTLEISFLCQTDQLVSYSSSRTARISLFLVSAGGNFSRQDMKLLKRGQGIMGCYLFLSIMRCISYNTLLSDSSCIQSVLIGMEINVEYRNCRWTLDVYLLFAIWMGLEIVMSFRDVTVGKFLVQPLRCWGRICHPSDWNIG